jgi:hypothetical protein
VFAWSGHDRTPGPLPITPPGDDLTLFMKDIMAGYQQDGEQFTLVPDASLAENGIESLFIIMLFSQLEEGAKITPPLLACALRTAGR